jgi:hypothetical protein
MAEELPLNLCWRAEQFSITALFSVITQRVVLISH